MSFLKKLLGRKDESDEDLPVTLNVEARRTQLSRLEKACDELVREMRAHSELVGNPGWKERSGEYGRVAGQAMLLRKGEMTRETLLDLVFEVRPVFSGPVPPEMAAIGPLQDEVVAAARELQELLPGELNRAP